MAHYLYDLTIIGGGSGGAYCRAHSDFAGCERLAHRQRAPGRRLFALWLRAKFARVAGLTLAPFANRERRNRVNKCNMYASSHVAEACAVTSCLACCSAQTTPLTDVLLSTCCSSIPVLFECHHPFGTSVCADTDEARSRE